MEGWRDMKSADNAFNKIRDMLYKKRVYWVVGIHVLATVVGYAGAFEIRFDFTLSTIDRNLLYATLPYLIISRMATYIYFNNIYVSFRHSGLKDFWELIKAQTIGTVLFLSIMFFMRYLDGFSRSVFIIEYLLTLMVLIGVHFLRKFLIQLRERRFDLPGRNVLIVGAGNAGVILLGEIKQNDRLDFFVVGFVDDNPYKSNTYVQGVPVLGKISDIPELITKHNVDEVIVAMPSAPYKEVMKIAKTVGDSHVDVKILPGLDKLIDDGEYLGQLTNLSIDRLIGRKIVRFSRESDRRQIEADIKDKIVLVSGAGGSIGSEICCQIMEYNPKALIALERHESSLYDVELNIKKEYPSGNFIPIVGDIRNEKKIDRIFSSYPVDLIYHAAAYKHVPMMEREVEEAIHNNIFGTLSLVGSSIKYKVKKFILISTDKAVNPTSIMGTTKRVAELILQSKNFEKTNGITKFISVRFGNVLESNGSVIPVFKRQIAQGGPITLTHREITRYFMSIPEAVQLVMTAGAMGIGGEIFLLDMGEPVSILDLANKLIRQAGLEPERDIEILVTGLRKGEKLHEELYWFGEGIEKTENKKITMLKPDCDKNAVVSLTERIARLRNSLDPDEMYLINWLKETVPESSIHMDANL